MCWKHGPLKREMYLVLKQSQMADGTQEDVCTLWADPTLSSLWDLSMRNSVLRGGGGTLEPPLAGTGGHWMAFTSDFRPQKLHPQSQEGIAKAKTGASLSPLWLQGCSRLSAKMRHAVSASRRGQRWLPLGEALVLCHLLVAETLTNPDT